MDRALSKSVKQQRQRKRWLSIGAVLLLLSVGLVAFRSILKTEVSRKKIRFAVVEVGHIEQTLTASGEILPEFEQRLISPIQARIEAVLLPAGSVAEAGQPILALNKEHAQDQRKTLFNEWRLAQNSLTKLKLQQAQALFDLNTSLSVQQLKVKQLKQQLDKAIHLQKIGGKTLEEVEQVQLDWEIAKLQEAKLSNELKSKKQHQAADLAAEQIQLTIKKQALEALDHKLEQSEVSTNRKGIVTWANEQIGSMVRANEEVARVADLSSFRVLASISSTHAEKLSSGMQTIIRVNQKELRGSIVNIQPEVKNNAMKFTIALADKSNTALRPNMKVQVYVVTGSSQNTLKVKNGQSFTGKTYQSLFVLQNGQLEKRQVKIGLSNFDEVELLENIKAGEQIVISGLKEYEHLETIKLID